jgi:hypothetical protein
MSCLWEWKDRLRIVVLLLASGCLNGGPTDTPAEDGPRALFIGNSYLYWHDIPGMVQAMTAAAGEPIAVATLAGPDMALIDHWDTKGAQRAIAEGNWEWVVLQQGPSSVEVNRDTLRMVTQWLAAEMEKVGATPALFSAWPSQDRLQDYPRAIESYRLAASDVSGTFLPVASAWFAVLNGVGGPRLYDDGLHPTVEGAYLSALVVYACLLYRSPVGVPTSLDVIGVARFTIGNNTAAMLQNAAAEVARSECGVP